MPEDKILCRTPTPGKKPVRIDRWKYEMVRSAILRSLPKSGDGLLFRDLPRNVKKRLSSNDTRKLGSVGWYTTVVKLDLEVRGEVMRVEGSKPQRLLKT